MFLLPGTYLAQALQVAERLRRGLASSPMESNGQRIQLTASFGVGTYQPGESIDADGLLDRVDRALLEAKRRGRDLVFTFEQAPSEVSAAERAALSFDSEEGSKQVK